MCEPISLEKILGLFYHVQPIETLRSGLTEMRY